MFFVLSKTAWLLIQPIGLLVLGLSGILLASVLQARRLVRLLAFLSLLLLVVSSQTNAGRLLLQPLENRFVRPAELPPAVGLAGVIVLGGGFDGHVTRERGGFELGESGDRFVEALRLARAMPDAPVVVSGGEASLIGKTEGDAPVAVRFFEAFDVGADRLVLEDKSLNTHENAVLTKEAIAGMPEGRWLLITSAFHMPRAVGAFRKQGVDVIAWPVDFRTSGKESFSIGRDDPLAALAELSLGMREWVGLIVYAATGRITGAFPR